MSDYDVRQVVLSTDDLDESIRFYSDTLGFALAARTVPSICAMSLTWPRYIDESLSGASVVRRPRLMRRGWSAVARMCCAG